MACKFPHAKDLPELWRVVSTGEVTFADIDDSRWKHSAFFDPNDVRAVDKTYVRKGAFIDGVDEFAALHYGLAPRRVQVMDPQHRLVIEATRQALQDAGYENKPFDRSRTGVFIGASVSEYKDLMTARHRAQQSINGEFGDTLNATEAEALKASVADVAPARAFTIAGSLLNMMACSVAQTFDLNGPALSIDAACSSALVAIHEATINLRARQVQRGHRRRRVPEPEPRQPDRLLAHRRHLALGRVPAVRRARRRLRDGRGRGPGGAQAPRGRAARRRPHLRGAQGHRAATTTAAARAR